MEFEVYFIRAGSGVISHTIDTSCCFEFFVNQSNRIVGMCISEANERLSCQFALPSWFSGKPPLTPAATYDPEKEWLTLYFNEVVISEFVTIPELPKAQYGIHQNGLIGALRISSAKETIALSMTPEQYKAAEDDMNKNAELMMHFFETGDMSVFGLSMRRFVDKLHRLLATTRMDLL